VLLAMLATFIWSGSRSAMLLAFMVSAVVENMILGGSPLNWRLVLPLPIVFGTLTTVAIASPLSSVPRGAAPGVMVEGFAVLVYFSAILAVFMAPFSHGRHFGWPGVALYAALIGLVGAGLSAMIW